MILVATIIPLGFFSRPNPSLLPFLLLLCLHRPCHCLPFTHQIQTPLFSPPLVNPCSTAPLHLQTQVRDWLDLNILCNCVLAAGDISLRLLQPCLLHHLSQKGVPPDPIYTSTRLFDCQRASHLILKAFQIPSNTWGCEPCLQYK